MEGIRPNMIPITIEKITETIMAGTLIATGTSATWDIKYARPIPVSTPSIPPRLTAAPGPPRASRYPQERPTT